MKNLSKGEALDCYVIPLFIRLNLTECIGQDDFKSNSASKLRKRNCRTFDTLDSTVSEQTSLKHLSG